MTDPIPAPPATSRYFMVRASAAAEPDGLIGLVELLGSGDKRTFASAAELLGHVRDWLRDPRRESPAVGPGAGE